MLPADATGRSAERAPQAEPSGKRPQAGASFLFLDVDGVLHPLCPTGAPLLATSEAMLQRADD